jgi:hypothetical protein
MEHTFGSRKTIYVNNYPVSSCLLSANLSIGEIEGKQFNAFLGSFSKNLYKNLRENDALWKLKIDYNGYSRNRNIAFWETLKFGSYFYNIDLTSAYWQIARRLGYIDERIFKKYQSDSYKKAKRYCVSFLARKSYVEYFDGRIIDRIDCDITLFKNIYDNIRNELYICISKAVKVCNERYVEYNIDGISVCAKDVDKVRLVLDKLKLTYKITECKKINNYEYVKQGETRNFRTKI